MQYTYRTKGVCSQAIRFEIEDDIIRQIEFDGGCDGNTQGIASLVTGMKTGEVIKRLKGIRCGFKQTSCPDQLARAVEEALAQRPGMDEAVPDTENSDQSE